MAYLKLQRQIEAEDRRSRRIKITREMYKQAIAERRPLLRMSRTMVTENGVSYWEDAPPWLTRPEDIDDGHGALRGRNRVQRPISTAKMEPRAQGSMPGRAAKAVALKERAAANREIDPETGKIVSNKLPSERSHHNRYSSKSVRAISTLSDGRRVVTGRSGRILKTLTERVNRVRRVRMSGWKPLTETEG